MNTYLFIGLIIIVFWIFTLFPGLLHSIQSGFKEDPSKAAYHSSETKEKQSQRTTDIEDRNQRMMDDLRRKMERQKR